MPSGFDKPVLWRQELSPDVRVLLAEAMERRKNHHHGIISLEPGSQSGFHSRSLLPVTERLRDTRHGQERALRSLFRRLCPCRLRPATEDTIACPSHCCSATLVYS